MPPPRPARSLSAARGRPNAQAKSPARRASKTPKQNRTQNPASVKRPLTKAVRFNGLQKARRPLVRNSGQYPIPVVPQPALDYSDMQVARGRRQPQSAGRNSGGGPSGLASASAAAANSGLIYQASLADPFSYQGARVPDLVSVPTTTQTSYYLLRSPSILFNNGAGITGRYTMFQVYPSPAAFFRYPTSVDASGVITWGSWVQFRGYSTITANFVGVRPVSAGLRLVNQTQLAERGGVIFAQVYGGGAGSQPGSSSSNPFDALKLDPGTTVVSGSDPQTDGTMVFSWRPADNNDLQFGATNATPTAESSILTVLIEHSDDADDESWEVEVVANVELLPIGSGRQLFETAVCLGGPEDSSRAQDAIMAKAGQTQSNTGSNFMGKVLGAARSVIGFGKKALGVGQQAVKFAEGFAGIASMFAMPAPNPELDAHHFAAVARGDLSQSPYYLDHPMSGRDALARFVALNREHASLPTVKGRRQILRAKTPLIAAWNERLDRSHTDDDDDFKKAP